MNYIFLSLVAATSRLPVLTLRVPTRTIGRLPRILLSTHTFYTSIQLGSTLRMEATAPTVSLCAVLRIPHTLPQTFRVRKERLTIQSCEYVQLSERMEYTTVEMQMKIMI